jgi:N-carbamoyl-L-amino-acid hydrolase
LQDRIAVDADRLLARIRELGTIGRSPDGTLSRLAGSDADRAGRDALVGWLKDAGLSVEVDAVGNIFGTLAAEEGSRDRAPIMAGSHIDTVVDAGIYDGAYGVLAALEAAQRLRETGARLRRPLVVAAFTNEEGVRYQPDMMGSLVHAGGLPPEAALASRGADGTALGAELRRIGYAGAVAPGTIRPHAYVELHVEQGPVLEREGIAIGAVENLQGISWQRVAIDGVANHAGTTPMGMRRDAGHAAARVMTFLHDRASGPDGPAVATVGCMRFEPDVINVIPSRAVFTVDLRDPDEGRLRAAEAALSRYLEELAEDDGVTVSVERLARFEPVAFDQGIVARVEEAAASHGLASKRMTSGAGHDAQMMARICPAAMIFVPSAGGVSHNPREYTPDADLVAGAEVLLDVLRSLAER